MSGTTQRQRRHLRPPVRSDLCKPAVGLCKMMLLWPRVPRAQRVLCSHCDKERMAEAGGLLRLRWRD